MDPPTLSRLRVKLRRAKGYGAAGTNPAAAGRIFRQRFDLTAPLQISRLQFPWSIGDAKAIVAAFLRTSGANWTVSIRQLILKLVRCPRSLAPTLVILPSMSLIPFAPFDDMTANEQSRKGISEIEGKVARGSDERERDASEFQTP
jgi:hypothetical protein